MEIVLFIILFGGLIFLGLDAILSTFKIEFFPPVSDKFSGYLTYCGVFIALFTDHLQQKEKEQAIEK